MNEIKDGAQLTSFLHAYQLEEIFPAPLRPQLSLCSFEQGELICTQGEASRLMYVLVKGKIKIFNTSTEGRTLVISFKTPLEVIGDIEYIRGIDIINTVEAVSPVVMIGVHYRSLKTYSHHPQLLHFLLDIITKKFFIKSNAMSMNLMYPVEVRLASYLLSMSYDETDSEFRGHLSATSLTDTANLIGTSYRHLNRVIQKLCAEGMIERSRMGIYIKDRERLIALASHSGSNKEMGS
ncbi:CRP-like cAMP-binding protein [Paenibacillus endophyticus]|uniref:CRP-like cAMP-binding protein n=1 Tax=Paenibacillus endophyticus TaxID=1294268 RepID=A0A7W5CEN0_9BACL|nr:helix-turn-helix domain-containing protein [Paenibacillus endophyticus]MBB3155494.1 CRP-like cAMP-binding protein [Paenibacillus endophyticus]